ncbi:MAG: hypothetical protein M3Y22_00125 [Pseudomonadota bacterium]|nr:hypothetical protein [Pseudomonadota bacterium]
MAQRTLSRMYDNYDDAKAVVHDLEASGVPHSEISLIANADAHGRSSGPSNTAGVTGGGDHPLDPADRTDTDTSAGGKRGAVLGTALGGGAGLLAGIGALAIPGVGPVVAAGWLVATLAGAGVGAASGGLIGSLTGAGVSRDEAHVYAEGVKRGGSLVTVRADETEASRIEAILAQHGTDDWQQRRTAYGADWKGFDEATRSTVATPSVPLPEAGLTNLPGSTPTRGV